MDKKKKITEDFKNEMGFKSCEITNTQSSNKQELFGTQKPIIDMECKNSYDTAFECTGLIDIHKKKIIKSACGEKNQK